MMRSAILFFITLLLLCLCCPMDSYLSSNRARRHLKFTSSSFSLLSSSKDSSLNNRQDAANKMSIDEIKSELDLRGVNYESCTTKSELVQLLVNSRVQGVADPSIIDQFNQNTKENVNADFNEEVISQATSKDGTLPGGLSPQIVKAMASDPEIMRLLRDPKMQDVMKAVMTSGPEGLKKYLSDPGEFIASRKCFVFHCRSSICRCHVINSKVIESYGESNKFCVIKN